MFYLATTRFTTKTWNEHKEWFNKKNNLENKELKSFYNSPNKICDKVPLQAKVLVIEMNNDTNQILGIGIIKNSLWNSKKCNIHSDNRYNRYFYKGVDEKRIDRKDLLNQKVKIKNVEISLLILIEEICFSGSTHSKRHRGITLLPKSILNNKHINLFKLFHNIILNQNKSV
tara:strand:- start:2576 stop:3091 length:516 start_codon:yes stop_codon:yes gene_type:complete